MLRKALAVFLLSVVPGSILQAASTSGTAIFPAGGATPQALLVAAKDLLTREGYEIQKLAPQEGRIEGSATYYDTANAGGPGVAKSTLVWSLTVRTESDGRVTVLVDHRVEGGRELEKLPAFLWNLAVGAGVSPSKVLLTSAGETKPLPLWNQRKSPQN
jgi:hypothetical protein